MSITQHKRVKLELSYAEMSEPSTSKTPALTSNGLLRDLGETSAPDNIPMPSKRVLRKRLPRPSPTGRFRLSDKPKIILEAKFRQVVQLKRGHSLTIKAKINGFPKPTVSWFYLEHEIITNNHYIVGYKGRTAHLTIKEGNDFVGGIYRIVARNEKGLTGNYINIVIVGKPMIFFENEFLERVEVKLGEALTIEANIDSYTVPSISCLYNEKEIRTDKNFHVEIKVRKVLVTIREESDLDRGILCVVAENEHGVSRKYINIEIVGKPEIILEERFKKETIELRMGESLRIEAKILGFPMPTIYWYHDIDQITTCENYLLEMEDNISRLTIREGNGWVHGVYRLIAKNNLGLTTVEINIDVIETYHEFECYTKENKLYYLCELM